MSVKHLTWLMLLTWVVALGGGLLAAVPVQALPAAQAAATATVLVDRLNVRAGPGTTYKAVGAANNGEILTVTGKSGQCTWLQVARAGQPLGWVSGNKAYVRLSTSCAQIPAAAATATPATTPAAPASEGCATVVNQLGFDVDIDLERSDGWQTNFTVATGAERQYCVTPGRYTATLSSPARPGSMSFPLTVKGGENYRIPLVLPGQ